MLCLNIQFVDRIISLKISVHKVFKKQFPIF